MTTVGAVPVEDLVPGTEKSSKQILHIVKELTGLFLSKLCLSDLGSYEQSFSSRPTQTCGAILVKCGCPGREKTPDPPALPFPAVLENIDKLKKIIMQDYSTSMMNL